MKNWLILWKTWTLEEIVTPWPFTIYKQEVSYKSRKDGTPIDMDTVHGIYQTLIPSKISKFEEEYIAADVLATVIKDHNKALAFNQIKSLFKDAELEECLELTDDDAAQVLNTLI